MNDRIDEAVGPGADGDVDVRGGREPKGSKPAKTKPRSRLPRATISLPSNLPSSSLPRQGITLEAAVTVVARCASAHDIDVSFVEERGRVLENALAQHGVETRLVGMVIGPSVTRYELSWAPV